MAIVKTIWTFKPIHQVISFLIIPPLLLLSFAYIYKGGLFAPIGVYILIGAIRYAIESVWWFVTLYRGVVVDEPEKVVG